MNLTRFLISFAMVVMLAGCGPDPVASNQATANGMPSVIVDSPIVGVWSSVDGPYKAIYEYRADGLSLQHVGGTTRGPSPFRIEGDSIIVTATMPSGRVLDEKTRFSLDGDTLIFFDGDGETRSFSRTSTQ